MAAATPHGVWWLAAGTAAWTAWNGELANLDVRALAFLPSGEALAGTGAAACSPPRPRATTGRRADGLTAPGARFVTVARRRARRHRVGGNPRRGVLLPGLRRAGVDARGARRGQRRPRAGGERVGCDRRLRGVPLLVSAGLPRTTLALESLASISAEFVADLDRGSLSAALLKALGDGGVTVKPTDTVRTQAAGSAWWIDAGQGVLLLRLDAGAIRVRRPRGLATLMGARPTSPTGVPVADSSGNEGTLTPRSGELLWQPASGGSQAVGEVATVAASASTGLRSTTITLQRPLANAYDPSTVKVLGNLAAATQGATQGAWPYPEVLGSGIAAAAGQSFRPARSPLTYVPADNPSGRAPELKVWVNGVEWTRVDTLYGQPANAAAYEVRVDENGAATILFGDGIHGARLPTGVGNVTAQYRVGIGPSGNLGAGRVTVLRSAPLGVRSVTNPVPAEGGANGQTPAQAAADAPREARVLERVVSLDDFADYALGYPGISKAVSALRDRRGRAVVVVTVAGGLGGPEAPDAGLVGELQQAMVDAGAQGRFQGDAVRRAGVRGARQPAGDPAYHAQAVVAGRPGPPAGRVRPRPARPGRGRRRLARGGGAAGGEGGAGGGPAGLPPLRRHPRRGDLDRSRRRAGGLAGPDPSRPAPPRRLAQRDHRHRHEGHVSGVPIAPSADTRTRGQPRIRSGGNATMREGFAPAGPRHRRARTDVAERRETLARRGLGAVGNGRIVAYGARSPARSAAEGHAQNRSSPLRLPLRLQSFGIAQTLSRAPR